LASQAGTKRILQNVHSAVDLGVGRDHRRHNACPSFSDTKLGGDLAGDLPLAMETKIALTERICMTFPQTVIARWCGML
jgi:hypothetical protein